jgi:PPK2 family polyphosphate:nucleotide phosphotransferase
MRIDPVSAGAKVPLTDEGARLDEFDQQTKSELERRLEQLTERLDRLQEAMHAEGTRAVLVVLQGRDTSGKDGTIRGVLGPLNPQGVIVTSFKAPTVVELDHDYLWRVHQAVPPRGAIGVFNRSHYEDVLAVRVHNLVPEAVWRPRYEQINQFEKILTQNDVTILKFMLHISREEQRKRLRARLDDPEKYWKFSPGDLKEREKWDDYTAAYQEMLERTSTAWAPWYVVPADRKPVRDVLVAGVLLEALERMNPRFPPAPDGLEEFRQALDSN